MKVKNLNFAEKYLEKLLLVVAVLFGLAVIWFKFAGQPYSVEFRGMDVAPDAVERQIAEVARNLKIKINLDDTSELDPVPDIPEFYKQFTEEQSRSLVPLSDTIVLGGDGLPINPDEISGWDRQYYVATPPAPATVSRKRNYGVLAEPDRRDLIPAFELLIGAQAPRDFRWVSVSAIFDLGQWRELLEAEPTEPGMQKMPEQWWRDKVAVTDVVLERQEYDFKSGNWGETVLRIEGLPNNPLAYSQPRTSWTSVEASREVQWIKEHRRDITKPPFPRLRRGVWERPDVDFGALLPQQRIDFQQLADEIAILQQRIAEMQAAKQVLGEVMEAAVAEGRRPVAGRGAAPPVAAVVAPGGRSAVAPRGGAAGDVDAQPTSLEAMRERLALLYLEQDRILGVADEAELAAAEALAAAVAGGEKDAQAGIAQQVAISRVTAWAHDITAKPGRTYRYRLAVKVLNPLFRESQVPKQQKEENYNRLQITSAFSEWSEHVEVERNTHFYFVEASPQKGTAQIEIYTIFNGRRLRRDFSPKPGDMIGNVVELSDEGFQRPVNLGIDAMLVDVQFDVPARGGLKATTHRIICLDAATGQMFERTIQDDGQHQYRLKLKHEADRQQVARQ